ncbi:MAG: hypothetical protein EBU08_13630 [Micrococcales bacterium]|nr:hypothetical protein [Micrococcales bacterium]
MDKVRNPCIASIFMNNIDRRIVETQSAVVKKYNKSNVLHYPVLTDGQPGQSMDKLVGMLEERGHDAIMFLDIDCLPLSYTSLDYFFQQAYDGKLIGDAQRSNHIQNDQHVFCAPHNITFTIETYEKLGRPSFNPNHRGDVSEELTFRAREVNIPIEIIMPLHYDAPPIRMDWEPKDAPPYWDLADGMPKYGIGTS